MIVLYIAWLLFGLGALGGAIMDTKPIDSYGIAQLVLANAMLPPTIISIWYFEHRYKKYRKMGYSKEESRKLAGKDMGVS